MPNFIECPVCGRQVAADLINDHLDQGCPDTLPRTSSQPPGLISADIDRDSGSSSGAIDSRRPAPILVRPAVVPQRTEADSQSQGRSSQHRRQSSDSIPSTRHASQAFEMERTVLSQKTRASSLDLFSNQPDLLQDDEAGDGNVHIGQEESPEPQLASPEQPAARLITTSQNQVIRSAPMLPGEVQEVNENIESGKNSLHNMDDDDDSSLELDLYQKPRHPTQKSRDSTIKKTAQLIPQSTNFPVTKVDAEVQTEAFVLHPPPPPRKAGSMGDGLDDFILPSQKVNALDLLAAQSEESLNDLFSEVPMLSEKGLHKSGLIYTSLGRVEANELKKTRSQSIARSIQKLNDDSAEKKRAMKKIRIMNQRAKLSAWKRTKYDIKRWWRRKKREIAKRSLLFWSRRLRFIESRFGSGIVSYFTLFRWLFLLDIGLGIFWLTFIVIFGIIYGFTNNNQAWNEFADLALNRNPSTNVTNPAMTILQTFTGQGPYGKSFFFYGYYPATMFESNPVAYHLDAAYLSISLAFFLISFLLIVMKMKKIYMNSVSVGANSSEGGILVDEHHPFSSVIFSAWDYSIRVPETRTNHNFAISTMFKTLLGQLELQEKARELTTWESVKKFTWRLFINLIYISIIGLAGLIVYVAMCLDNPTTSAFCTSSVLNQLFSFFGRDSNVPASIQIAPILISVINTILPFIFKRLTKAENYVNPSTAENVTLARTYVLKMASIYLILINYLVQKDFFANCWETKVGQTFYQLVWTDSIITMFSTVFVGFLTKWIWGKAKYDFALSDNILELTYRQALVWIGTVYSPMLIIVSLITGFLMFYVKSFTLSRCGLPPKRIYNSYAQNIYFLFVLLLTLALTAIPVFYSFTRKPSCGPFSSLPAPKGQGMELTSVYDWVTQNINQADPGIKYALNFIGSIGAVAAVSVVLGLWVYYLVAIGIKRNRRLKQLEFELNVERADKKFLLRYYNVKIDSKGSG